MSIIGNIILEVETDLATGEVLYGSSTSVASSLKIGSKQLLMFGNVLLTKKG